MTNPVFEAHKASAPRIAHQIISSVGEAGGGVPDVLVLLESITVHILRSAELLSGGEVAETFIAGVRERLVAARETGKTMRH